MIRVWYQVLFVMISLRALTFLEVRAAFLVKSAFASNVSRVVPKPPVFSLPEWEESEAVMTLWRNASFFRELSKRGKIKVISTLAQQSAWESWLLEHRIDTSKISFWNITTDSIWIRDYGPWFIIDGQGDFGIVDTIYNRPRPNDDNVPRIISRILEVPLFESGVVHTGGNYYNDGLGRAFSSNLVYRENSSLGKVELDNRMMNFLGIYSYITGPLGTYVTIEHIDTFGKLVAPDTWVFGEFPEGSRFRKDTENYVEQLRKLTSPYGGAYKIFRLKMVPRPNVTLRMWQDRLEDYRAYINSFISNRSIYFPAYGDSIDIQVKALYQAALPGYEAIAVDNGATGWGDSVHCRSRNLIKKNSIFLFPKIENNILKVFAFPSPGARFVDPPKAVIESESTQEEFFLRESGEHLYLLPLSHYSFGRQLKIYLFAHDSNGLQKVFPLAAPYQRIEYVVSK